MRIRAFRVARAATLVVAILLAWATPPASAATINYEYDNLGRVKAVIHDDGTRTDYAYDQAGNRTTVSTTGPTGTVQLTASSAAVAENVAGGIVTITVSRTGGSNGAASVNYATSNGTAAAAGDYTSTSGTLNWTNGDAANKTFNVPIIDDSTYEGNETFTVTLSAATGATLGGPSVSTITINENEVAPSGTLSLSPSAYSILEAATSVSVTVARTGGTNGAVSVQYATSNGTAASGSDYTAASGALNWANGDSANKSFSVPILDDSNGEPAETINLTLSSPGGGATLGTSSGTITINDNEPGTLQLSSSSYSIGENGTSLTVNVTRTGGSYGAASVNYGTTAGTALAASDYTTTSGTLNWTSGDAASKSFAIPIINNSAFEAAESFTTSVSGATGAALGTPSSATVTITDDDPPIPGTLSLSLTPPNDTILEASTSVTVNVTRTGGSDGTVGVQYATSNGSATAGSDYTAASGSLSWGNGDIANKTFSVPILDDSTGEPAETITLTLSNATGGASIGTSSGTLTINDNEPGALQFTAAGFAVNEPNTPVTITVSRTNGSYGAVSVSYATSNGTATSGSDYTAASGTLNWTTGDAANKSFNVTIANDSTWESNETFTATLSSPGGGAALGSPNPTTVTIVDEDGPGLPTNLRSDEADGVDDGTAFGGNYSILWDTATGSIHHYTLEETRTDPTPLAPVTYTINAPTTSQAFSKGNTGAEKRFEYRVRACTSTNESVCSAYTSIYEMFSCPSGGCP